MARVRGKHEAPRKPREKTGKPLILATAVIGALCVAFFAAALCIGKGGSIHPNIKINGVELSGMSVSEAKKALDDSGWLQRQMQEVKVSLRESTASR